MEHALTAEQMRAREDAAIASGAVTLGDLMERAGAALAAEVTRRAPSGDVAIACGPGNNGGDGWVAARLLLEGGRRVCVLSLVAPESLGPPATGAVRAALAAGVPFEVCADGALDALRGSAVIVDALFGFGFHGAMSEAAASIAGAINASGAVVISADMPSGVDADTGAADASAVRADSTVAFTALKRGLLLHPGASYAGEVVVADIGLPASTTPPDVLEVPGVGDISQVFPWPRPEDHKGARGRVAIVAGSAMYSGAAVLAVSGALRLGAGYVFAVVPETVADVVRAALPAAIVRAVPATHEGSMARVDAVLTAIADADALVVGPGLTTVPSVGEIVHALIRDATVPMVFDADGLNALGGDPSRLDGGRAPIVITPHPGEAARLLGCDVAAITADRAAAAQRLSSDTRTCLVKGPGTIVAGNGRLGIVRAGNAGLARAGSGDVLAGMIGTLLAQGMTPYEAALAAAHLHGRAAEFGTAALTETCFTASDITRFLPDAVREVASG